MNAVQSPDVYEDWKVLRPSTADGRFWTVWNWVVVPVAVLATVALGTLSRVRWWLVAASYYVMISGVTLAFHRYFSHASFKTSRPFQLFLALWGCTSGQTGPISWELTHRDHHRLCETDDDPHAIQKGFWHAHGFFLLSYPARWSDLRRSKWARYPEVVWVEQRAPLLYYAWGALWFAFTGFTGFVWYFLVPTFLSWNATMLVNSWAHLWGDVDYDDLHQPDACRARNVRWAWPVLLGDNWHNNHHAYPSAAWQGWYPDQLDPNGRLIQLLAWLGLVWDPVMPKAKVLAKAKRTDRPLPAVAE